MKQKKSAEIYQELGVRPVINARGTATVVGGSLIAPEVQHAMEYANRTYARMEELIEKAGEAIARQLGAEAAYLTSGCFAALAIGAAAIMTGTKRNLIAKLPDTTGMRNKFLLQKRMRYHFDRCVTVPGGVLKEVGDDSGTTRAQLDAAIGSRTAGILYPAHLQGTEGTLSLKEVVEIAHQRGVAVLVDAAFQVYPLDHMTGLARSGADLVCFSAKYMGGPNSVGFLCGKKHAIKAAVLHGFVAYEEEDTQSFGRGYKLDRQEVAATVVVLREWFAMNHQERLRTMEKRIQVMAETLGDLPHVKIEEVGAAAGRPPWAELWVHLKETQLGKTAKDVETALLNGEPRIWVARTGNTIKIRTATLNEGEEYAVARRLRGELQG